MAALRELHFRAMGCAAQVVATGGPASALEGARARLAELESRWSRFVQTSEVSRLNAAAGCPVLVSPETFALVERAVAGWRATAGRFDPTVLGAVVAAGYDRSFEALADDLAGEPPTPRLASPGCAGIRLDPALPAVTLPVGTGIDPGGIGKGLAADVVVAELLGAGARGACVNLGGDLRVAGDPPDPEGWLVAVEHPARPTEEVATLALADGGVATSSRLARTWMRAGERRHHLVDPATGGPPADGLLAVTAVAGEAWWAEVLAKAAFVAGPAEALGVLVAGGAGGLVVDDDGVVRATAALDVGVR